MSLLRSKNLQVGMDATATNNFTLYQPATLGGQVRLGNGNSGSATDLITVTSSGAVGIGTTDPASYAQLTMLTSNYEGVYLRSTNTTGVRARILNDASNGIGFTVYGNTYSAGSVASVGANGSAVGAAGGNLGLIADTGKNIIFGIGVSNTASIARFDSAGNFGLGVVPSTWSGNYKGLQVGEQILSGVGGQSLQSFNAYYNGSWKYISSNYANYIEITSGKFTWNVAPSGTAGSTITFTPAMILDASGNLLVGKTTATTNGGDIQTGNGITFPAAQSACADANTLDDYEEGTFTPAVYGTTATGAATYIAQMGAYTKIGQRVFFEIYLDWSAHTGTGNIQIQGLPFTSTGLANYYSTFAIRINNMTLTASNYPQGIIGPSTTTIALGQNAVGGGANSAIPLDTAANIIISGSYIV